MNTIKCQHCNAKAKASLALDDANQSIIVQWACDCHNEELVEKETKPCKHKWFIVLSKAINNQREAVKRCSRCDKECSLNL